MYKLLISLSFSCRLGAVMCMGVTAGAYILTQFAVRYLSSLFSFHISITCYHLTKTYIDHLSIIFGTDEIQIPCDGVDSCFSNMQSSMLDGVVI